jgi:low temperature requirement protein LtrA
VATPPGVRPDIVSPEDQGVTFVELFFDLVFVFGITGVTALVREDLTWPGVGRAILALWLIWWAWTQFTWTLNPADTTHVRVRLTTLAATAAAFFMAAAVPDAWGSGALVFGSAYVAVRLLGLWLQVQVSTGEENRAAVRAFALRSLTGLAAVVAGAALGGRWQAPLWAVAVMADLVTVLQVGRMEWRVHPGHFAERHGLIVIIALGESLIATGLGLGHTETGPAAFVVGATAVATICALWWTYFGAAKEEIEAWLGCSDHQERGRRARDAYSLGHLPIIAGIIGVAVGMEEAVAHPTDALSSGVMASVGAGVSLYLLGVGYGLGRARRGVAWLWVAAAGVCVAALVLVRELPPPAALLGVAGVLVALATLDRPRRRERAKRPADS